MAQDTAYQPIPFVYASHGLSARIAYDRCGEYEYIQYLNVYEREENAVSSRYGTQIINRDPVGVGTSNYFFTSPVTSLARLNYNANAYRYAGLGDGSLYRRVGDTQGAYTQIYSGLSGNTFQSLVTTCYETSQPYIFIYDQNASIKDSGVLSSPQLTGIDRPPYTANALPFSPLLTMIDDFDSGRSYITSGFSGSWAYSPLGSIPVNSGSQVTDFPQFLGGTTIPVGILTADNTLSIPPNTSSSTNATASGFSGPLVVGESVTVTLSDVTASFSLTGSAQGSGTVELQYTINNGDTWVTFYSQSFSASQSADIGTVSTVVPGIRNLAYLQYRIVSTSTGTSGTGNVVMNASSASSAVIISVADSLANITNGMISVIEGGGGGNVSVSQTIYCTPSYEGDWSYTPDWEFNSNELRTVGGVTGGTLTNYCIATNYGFSIPLTAVIQGIVVTLYWVGQNTGTGILTNAELVYGGTLFGTVKNPGAANTSFLSNTSMGSDVDLWGTGGITPAQINSPTFGAGVQITAEQVGSTTRSFIASMTITVYYSTGGGGGGGGTALSSIPIASINSSGWDGTKYNTLTITTGVPHGITSNANVSIYGCTNDLCDGFYTGTETSSTTLTVPFVSVAPLGATGGTLYYYPGGVPSVAMLADIYSRPWPPQLSAFGFYEQVPLGVTTFPIGYWSGSVAANSTATVEIVSDFDLSINNQVTDADLIVLTLQVGDPNNISNIRLQFDVNGSGYTSSYYYANISPAYYQANIANDVSAYDATQSQILADALGLITGQPIATTTAQLQPSNFSTGASSWTAVYIPRGNFLPVGGAGQSGLDWSNITGWQLVIETNSGGSSTVACNGLYLQWGYGPSSFAGTGYDYRYTYFDINTFTESSPSPIQNFNDTYGYLSSLNAPFYLRQAVQLTGLYSSDPQVTHLRIYRRGGTRNDNWLQIDQVPNITGGGQFFYKDAVADAALAQAQILVLDNDPPVTSSLFNPIFTTLSAATSGPGQSIYSTYAPQTISVSDASAVFVPEQIVLVGNAYNLEEVAVITGGIGNFTAILRLTHNAGESVQVNSVPRQPCNLCAYAYGQVWLAGDKNNPHYLYRSKKGFPENFSPADYFPVSTPDDPVMGVINWRGTLVVATLKTWWIVANGSTVPQPTGATHGLVAQNAWTLDEGGIWFQASDGMRRFTGADGVYMSLPVEWVFQNNPLCLPPQMLQADASECVMAYYNNMIFNSYVSTRAGNPRYRMIFDTRYRRYRYDDVPATAMLWEKDTNAFLVGKQVSPGNYAVVQDWIGDYDDGGWSGGSLVQTPINMTIQHPYRDLGKPHYPKQWNMLETDVNTNNNVMTTTMLFEDGTISISLPTQNTGSVRKKLQFSLTDSSGVTGDGQQAYRASILHTISVLNAPILYQEDVYAAILADYKANYDTYWIKFGSDLSKFVKEGYFDYTSPVAINCSLFADNSTTAYWTFTLPAQSQRYVQRVRFGNVNPGTTAFTMRTWRLIANSSDASQPFQMWKKPMILWKPIGTGHSFRILELEE